MSFKFFASKIRKDDYLSSGYLRCIEARQWHYDLLSTHPVFKFLVLTFQIQAQCDLLELSNAFLPDFHLQHEVQRVCRLKSIEEDGKKTESSKYQLTGLRTRRPFGKLILMGVDLEKCGLPWCRVRALGSCDVDLSFESFGSLDVTIAVLKA